MIDPEDFDEDEPVIFTPPIPEARVTATLHGGPHDGETFMLPWARVELAVAAFDGDEMVESVYELVGPWLGQDEATYRYREPEPAIPIPVAAPAPAVSQPRAVWPTLAWFAVGLVAGAVAAFARERGR